MKFRPFLSLLALTTGSLSMSAAMAGQSAQADVITSTPDHPIQQIAQVDRKQVTVLTLAHGDINSNYWWWNSYYRGQGAARGISELLITELVEDGTYAVTDSSRIEDRSSNFTDESVAMDRASELGLDAVISGTITQFDLRDNQQCINVPFVGRTCTNETVATVQLNVRLVDPDTGAIIATAQGEGDAFTNNSSIDLRRGPDVSSRDSSAADELLTEATEEAIQALVPEIVAAQSRL